MKNVEYTMPETSAAIADEEEVSRLRWLAKYSKNEQLRERAQSLVNERTEDKQEATYAGVVAMRYRNVIQELTGHILWNIKEHGGMAPVSFMQAQVKEFKGGYALIAANVAIMAIGKRQIFACDLSEAQLSNLVEEAKRKHSYILHEIKELREKAGK
jgi:hypothetical protein